MSLPIEDGSGWIAAALAGLSGGGLVLWRSYLRMRADLRDDKTSDRTHSGIDLVDSTYREVIKGLRERVDAMDKAMDEMYTDFRQERAARLEAEERAIMAERRAELLKDRVIALEARLGIVIVNGDKR